MKKRILIFVILIITLLSVSSIVNAKIEINEETKIRASKERYQHIDYSIWDIYIAQKTTIGQDFLFVVDNTKFEVMMFYLGNGNVKVKNWGSKLEYVLSFPIGEPFDFCIIIGDFWYRIIIEDLLLEEVDGKPECIQIKSFGKIRAEKLSE